MTRLAYLLSLVALLWVSGSSAARPCPWPLQQPGGGRVRRAAEPPQRVVLAPQFVPGRVLRYQMEIRTTTEGRRTGLVEDPQAPTQLEMTWAAIVRVEVLGGETTPIKSGPDASGQPGNPSGARSRNPSGAGWIRLRTTYEKSTATARSDTFDPEAEEIEKQYHNLEGHAIEFTVNAEGKTGEVKGLQDILGDAKAAGAARESLTQLAMSTSPPREGIVPGQKWSSEQPAASAPLAGIEMRSESTYLRDERCRPAESSTALPPRARVVEQACAVILTRFRMSQPRTPRDPTPEEYRKSGLRTAGRWSGSGESLAYISLRTGWVVSVTQSGEQDMDVTVSTRDGGSGVRYAGQVRSQSQITLLPDSSPVH